MGTDTMDRVIRDYEYWTIFIAKNQFVLGKCVFWCKRDDAKDLADATLDEWLELKYIIDIFKESVENLFNPDLFNYTFLGNSIPHLHMHFVPRYKQTRDFNGQVFTDVDFGKEYTIPLDFAISEETLVLLKEKMQKVILKIENDK